MADQTPIVEAKWIVHELNDIAVQHHQCGDLRGAEQLYKEALHAMREYSGCESRAPSPDSVTARRKIILQRRLRSVHVMTTEDEMGTNCNTSAIHPIRMVGQEKYTQDDAAMTVILLHNMGLMYFLHDKLDAATSFLHMALSLTPKVSPGVAIISIHCILSAISLQDGDDDLALQNLIEGLNSDNDNSQAMKYLRTVALNGIGRILMSKGYVTESLEAFHAALILHTRHEGGSAAFTEIFDAAPAA